MSNFLNKIKLKTGSQAKKNRFDLSCQNLTTLGFNRLKPIYVRECMPQEKISINVENFTRLAPMSNPIMAQCRIVTRAFFVPYRTVWSPFNDFVTQTRYTDSNGVVKQFARTPYFSNTDLVTMFLNSYFSTQLHEGSEEDDRYASDFAYNAKYYQFTAEGRAAYDILLNLGYTVNFTDDFLDLHMSALPLLTFVKVMLDWYNNPQYDTYIMLHRYFKLEESKHFTANDLQLLLQPLFIQYDSDYFTSAFDKPLGPNVSVNGARYVNEAVDDDNGHEISDNSEGDVKINIDNIETLTNTDLHWIHRLGAYLERLRFTGSRLVDRFLTEYGIKLNNGITNRSVYLGKVDFKVQIGEVYQTSQAENESSGLGDYAGKGIAFGSGSYEYTADEFGYFIITAYVQPRTTTVQGIDRSVLHKEPLDFFHGDFDNLGYQAIAQGELFHDFKGDDYSRFMQEHSYTPTGVFGYQNRYAEYKFGRDRLTGNFRLRNTQNSYNQWHLFRLMENTNAEGYLRPITDIGTFRHSLDFTTAKSAPYNRIFADLQGHFDPFFSLFSFNVISYMPCKQMFEQYHYENDEGAEVTQTVGGTVLND